MLVPDVGIERMSLIGYHGATLGIGDGAERARDRIGAGQAARGSGQWRPRLEAVARAVHLLRRVRLEPVEGHALAIRQDPRVFAPNLVFLGLYHRRTRRAD